MVINTLKQLAYNIEYKSLRCVLPWFCFFLFIVIIQFRYSYIMTNVDNKISALESSTMYFTKYNVTPCLGDFVEFHLEETKRTYFRKIRGLPGDIIEFYDHGFRVNRNSKNLGQSWGDKAKSVSNNQEKLTIPIGKVFIVNTAFKSNHKLYSWPYALVPMKDIKKQLTYIIASKDLSALGKYIGGDSTSCVN